MTRVQILLTEEQDRRLERLAERLGDDLRALYARQPDQHPLLGAADAAQSDGLGGYVLALGLAAGGCNRRIKR